MLPPARQRQLSRNLGAIAAFVAYPAAPQVAGDLLAAVDFPNFVAALINGVFDAAVDASIKQMEAYAELVKNVARMLEAFAHDNISATQARDNLMRRFADLLDDADSDDDDDDSSSNKPKPAPRRPKRASRAQLQALVARITLRGINRIVVTTGIISARAKRR